MVNEWANAKLEDVLDYIQPTNYIVNSVEYSDEYKTPVLTAGKSFIIGYTNEENGIFDRLPTIIFDDFTTSIQFVNFKFKVKSSAMKILVPTSNLVDIRYVFYLMKTLRVNTDTHKRFWISIFSQLPIKIAPFPEQRVIADQIEEMFSDIDNAIENLNKAQEQLKIYRLAILKNAFAGKLTEMWRTKNKSVYIDRSAFPKAVVEGADDLSEIPREWIYTSLSNTGDLSRGKSKHRPRNDPKLFGGKYPFIQTGEIRSAKSMVRTYSDTYNDIGLAQSKLWPVGTLCITIAANIAETAFLGIEACFPDSVVGFSAFEIVANPKFIDFFIQSAKQKIQAYAPATAQKNINLTILENLIIPYCHLEEQRQIVQEIESRFSVCDQLETTICESLIKATALRQSILKRAFEGKLTEQWRAKHKELISDKNSAEALLKKIKAEKEALQVKPKGKKKHD